MALAAAAVTLVACASNNIKTVAPQPASTSSTPPPPPPPAGTTSPSIDTNQVVLSQYRHFWTLLSPASEAAPMSRSGLLAPYTTEPELGSLLAGIAHQAALGHAFYGQDMTHPQLAKLAAERRLAVINDCQDSTHTGLVDLKTQARLTVGVARNHVVATMNLGMDQTWRVASVTYPGTPC